MKTRQRISAGWRLGVRGRQKIAEKYPCASLLPADTRTPDHTIWHHLDTAAAFEAARAESGGLALLAFASGPVQPFIEAARSVRDLWSGGMVLSWLAFRSLLPVVELGPTALLYPALRWNPQLDLWLAEDRQLGNRAPRPSDQQKTTPSLPHRFLALVPWGPDGTAAHKLADCCRQACVNAWQDIANSVWERLKPQLDQDWPAWDDHWDAQIAHYFSGTTAVLPLSGSSDEIDGQLTRLLADSGSFAEVFSEAEKIRNLARSIPNDARPNYAQEQAGQWQYQIELVERALAAARSIRHIPVGDGENGPWPQKRTLFGSFSQMGPAPTERFKPLLERHGATQRQPECASPPRRGPLRDCPD